MALGGPAAPREVLGWLEGGVRGPPLAGGGQQPCTLTGVWFPPQRSRPSWDPSTLHPGEMGGLGGFWGAVRELWGA